MSKKFIMLIGLPFSGKSSLAQEYVREGYSLIERDALLDEVIRSAEFNDGVARLLAENPQELPEEVFALKNRVAIALLNEKVKKLVLDGRDEKFIYDGTNVQRRVREGLLGMKEEGVEIDGVFLDVPVEELKRRAQNAFYGGERLGKFNHQTPESVAQIAAMMERPEASEGFHELKVIAYEGAREVGREQSGRLR